MAKKKSLYYEEFVNKFILNSFFHIALILLLLVIYSGKYLLQFIKSDVIFGWDGSYHYAVTKEFSENIFPAPYGWLTGWFSGMPWPIGYPPFFSYFLSFLDILLPLKFITIFKAVIVILCFYFPVQIYLIAKRLKFNSITSLFSGLLSVFFLVSQGDFAGILGIAMGGTFENGLYPQFFASVIMLVWIYFFINFDKKKLDFIFSTIFFALIILSNVHVAQPAVITFVVCFFVRFFIKKERGILKKFLVHGLFSTLITSFWLLILFSTKSYFLTKTISNVPLKSGLFSILVSIVLSVVAFGFAVYKKQYKIIWLFISAVIVFFLAIFPIYKFAPGLPLQPFRILPFAYLIFMILSAKTFEKISEFVGFVSTNQRFFAMSILILPFFLMFPSLDKIIGGIYTLNEDDKRLITFLRSKEDKKSIVEVKEEKIPTKYLPDNTIPKDFLITSLIPIESTHQSLWGVFRESSISSPFVQAVRNQFSQKHESYGVVCWICVDKKNAEDPFIREFYDNDIDKYLKRTSFYDVQYIAVFSENSKAFLSKREDLLKKIEKFGEWEVYEIINKSQRAEVVNSEPLYVFSGILNGERKINSFDTLRISEEWLNDAKNYPYIFSDEIKIDENKDFSKFKAVFIAEYKYKDFDSAYNQLLEYSKNNLLFLNYSNDLLYKSFEKLGPMPNIVLIQSNGDVRKAVKEINKKMAEKFNQSIGNNGIVDYKEGKNSISISLKNSQKTHVYIKNSYFPFWKEKNGGKVYFVSPSQMIVETSSDKIELVFDPGRILYLGFLLTFIGFVGLFPFSLLIFRNKN